MFAGKNNCRSRSSDVRNLALVPNDGKSLMGGRSNNEQIPNDRI
ncbi:MAG: hypothetical protein SWY16_18260 [Cyanobacteriota bacterium]|nr:hypothetical protein [Cyanobacteriota bacterium]